MDRAHGPSDRRADRGRDTKSLLRRGYGGQAVDGSNDRDPGGATDGRPGLALGDCSGTESQFPAIGLYHPNNYNHRFDGPVTLRFALANSLNVAVIKVLEQEGGPDTLYSTLQRAGITTLEHPAAYYGLGLTIGDGEVRLLELANAYTALARLGVYKPFRLFTTSEHYGTGWYHEPSGIEHCYIDPLTGRRVSSDSATCSSGNVCLRP
jgi:Penicillin binding protein transpeptidase domain